MRCDRPLPMRTQRGFTLVELMVALVLGALVVLAATAMVVSSRGSYRTQDEATQLSESARAALELGNRLVRLAGYTDFGDATVTPPAYTPNAAWAGTNSYTLDGPNLVGSNNSVPGGGAGYNGSDSLTIRFYGTGTPTGDGNVLDCAGTAVPQPALSYAAYSTSRAFNVLYVGLDTDGEPALMCQRQTYDPTGTPNATLDTQVLIRGVEDFQVLYGEAIPQPIPNDDLDTFPPQAVVYRTGIGGPNPVVNWANVQTVRIAMVLRTGTGALTGALPATTAYPLFGSVYPGTGDTGSTFTLAAQSLVDRTRARRVVETTVFVRNRVASWPSLERIN